MTHQKSLGYLLIVGLLVVTCPSHAAWKLLKGNGDQNTNLITVGAASGTQAVTLGMKQSGGNPEKLAYATNDGETFNNANFPGYGGMVRFLDPARALAYDLFGKAYQSVDGGMSWQALAVANLGAGTMQNGDAAVGIAVSDDGQTIWVVGAAGKTTHSTDGGTTWVKGPVSIPGGDDSAVTAVAVRGQTVWIAGGVGPVEPTVDPMTDEEIPGHPGSGGFVLRSTDGGAAFEAVASSLPYHIRALSFVTPDEGWLAGGTFTKNGAIIGHTTDGGATWDTSASPEALPESEVFTGMGASVELGGCVGVEFFGRDVGVAACGTQTFEFDGSQGLFLTTDGGATWAAQPGLKDAAPGTSALAKMGFVTAPWFDVAFPDCHRGFMVGQGQVIWRWDNDDAAMDCLAGGAPTDDPGDGEEDGGSDDDDSGGDSGSCGCETFGHLAEGLLSRLAALLVT